MNSNRTFSSKLTTVASVVLMGMMTTACVPDRLSPAPLKPLPLYYKAPAGPTAGQVNLSGCDAAQPALGCSYYKVLQQMVAKEEDLVESQKMDDADGEGSGLSIQRYRAGETYELSDDVLIGD